MQVEYLGEDMLPDPDEAGPYDWTESNILVEPLRAGSEYTVSLRDIDVLVKER